MMGILARENGPQKPTVEQVAGNLQAVARRTFTTMLQSYEEGLRKFWKNQNYTPQEIADAWGVDAADMFRLHAILAAAILQANPEEKITDVATLGTFSFSNDGKLTAEAK